MNIVEAWKKAEIGDTIKLPCDIVRYSKNDYNTFQSFVAFVSGDKVLYEDWEVEKKVVHRKEVGSGYVFMGRERPLMTTLEGFGPIGVPERKRLKVTLEWDE